MATTIIREMTRAEKVAFIGIAGALSKGIQNETTGVPRLCIPPLYLRDGPSGVAVQATGVTSFPAEIGVAATFDPPLARSMGRALGQEAAGQGNIVLQAPGLDVSPFANWGRNFENPGESPALVSSIGASIVQGIQSAGVIALPKHLGPYVQETNRVALTMIVDPRTLNEIYLAPFRAAAAAGALGMMCSHGRTNGVNTCSSSVLASIRRAGFGGFFRPDWGAVTDEVAALKAGVDLFKLYYPAQIEKGLANGSLRISSLDRAVRDVLTAMFDAKLVVRTTPKPDASRLVSTPANRTKARAVADESQVLLKNSGALPIPDSSSVAVFGSPAQVAPLISGTGSAYVTGTSVVTDLEGIKMALGTSTVSYDAATPSGVELASLGAPVPSQTFSGYDEAPVALRAGTEGLVDFTMTTPYAAELLVDGHPLVQSFTDNAGEGSPTYERSMTLSSGSHTLALLWPTADARPQLTAYEVTPAITQAAAEASRARYAVVDVGVQEGEGTDLASLALPGYQDALVEAVAAANPRTIVVIHSGGPVLMPWLSRVNAVLESWYPGQEGGAALGDLVSGATCASGRLPVTFPASDATASMLRLGTWPVPTSTVVLSGPLGLYVGSAYYRAHGAATLFPFGFGLSCTTFSLGVERASETGGVVTVATRVVNTGTHTGRETVEAYVTFPPSAQEPPHVLKGFTSISLSPGAFGIATIELPASAFGVWRTPACAVEPGLYQVSVGTSATATSSTSTLRLGQSGCSRL